MSWTRVRSGGRWPATMVARIWKLVVLGDGDMGISLVPRLKQACASVAIGNPLDTNTLVGPLIDGQAFAVMQKALDAAKAAGGIVTGGTRASRRLLRPPGDRRDAGADGAGGT